MHRYMSKISTILTPIARKQSYDLLMPWSVHGMVMMTMLFLGAVLLLFYFS